MMQTARLPQTSHKSGDAMIKCFELESDVSVAALRTQAVKHSGAGTWQVREAGEAYVHARACTSEV